MVQVMAPIPKWFRAGQALLYRIEQAERKRRAETQIEKQEIERARQQTSEYREKVRARYFDAQMTKAKIVLSMCGLLTLKLWPAGYSEFPFAENSWANHKERIVIHKQHLLRLTDAGLATMSEKSGCVEWRPTEECIEEAREHIREHPKRIVRAFTPTRLKTMGLSWLAQLVE